MQTYWDLTEKQRAELTREQVQDFLNIELMSQGVLRPLAPTLEPITEKKLEPRRYFSVRTAADEYSNPFNLLFATDEQARAFIELQPLEQHRDWETGTTYAKKHPGLGVFSVDVVEEADVAAVRAVLTENRRRKERNDRAELDHRKACDVATKAEAGIWEDWYRCRAVAEERKRIVTVFDEYKGHTGGNVDLALTFLRKAFPEPAIKEAFEWFGVTAEG